MIELKPEPYDNFQCPQCGSDAANEKLVMPGMNAYAECQCSNCGLGFLQMLPTGHFVNAPLAIDVDYSRVYNPMPESDWLSKVTLKSFPLSKKPVSIRKTVYKQHREVIILNTLDFLYGHCLLKLYNAQHHLTTDDQRGLIIILPKIFEWMIPDGCAEVWVVDLTPGDLRKGYEDIARFCSREMDRFDKISLSMAYSHPDFTTVDIERFTGIKSFDLSRFYDTTPCATFILREDRWWHTNRMDYWLYRLCRKLKVNKTGNKILAKRQNRLVKKAIRIIRKNYPAATINIAGLGKTGNFKNLANDRRVDEVDDAIEKEWCRLYSSSHVVIGFHGSNMLLPTAFAAGCVEILPEDRYGNMVQDISVRFGDRRQLFCYRFVQQYCKPAVVANHAISIIRDYAAFSRNMCDNVYQRDDTDQYRK